MSSSKCSRMLVTTRLRLGGWPTSQELLFFDPLLDLLRCTRIHRFHLRDILGCQVRKPSDEMDETPRGLLATLRAGRPPRHAGKPDAVLDDIEQLAVGEILRVLLTHVGWLGEEAPTHLGIAASIVRVT